LNNFEKKYRAARKPAAAPGDLPEVIGEFFSLMMRK
jgi:hypothetical protein